MIDAVRNTALPPKRIGRSIAALAAGAAVAIVLSLGTDIALHAGGLFPALGQPMSDPLLALAASYRTLYGVIAAFVVAKLSPHHPLQHALIGGLLGMTVAVIGAVTTWNSGLGPHWYPIALIVLAMPPAWLGGKFASQNKKSK
jgi:hypothetical protein